MIVPLAWLLIVTFHPESQQQEAVLLHNNAVMKAEKGLAMYLVS